MCSQVTKNNILFDLTYSWINLSRVLKNFIDTTKISSTAVLLCKFPHIWIATTWPTKHAWLCQQQHGFILQDSFVCLYFWLNISQISQISTIRKKIQVQNLKLYVTTCFQIQSRIILFIFFGYILGSALEPWNPSVHIARCCCSRMLWYAS